jgi:hypothetical protein
MKNAVLILIGLFPLALSAVAQDTIPLMRPAYKLIVAVDNETFYEQQLAASPYVLPNYTIQLYPGESVYIEVEQNEGVIKKMTAIKTIKDSSKTISISFTQEAKGKVHDLMMLKMINPFPYKLFYKASIFILSQKKWISTDVYPVEARLSGYETWPDVITSIGLGDWKLTVK